MIVTYDESVGKEEAVYNQDGVLMGYQYINGRFRLPFSCEVEENEHQIRSKLYEKLQHSSKQGM